MKVKYLVEEDFVNYKKPSLFVGFPTCSFKCGEMNCQNSSLAHTEDIEVSKESICERYLRNPISEAFVFGGLEPFDSFMDLISLIDCIRNKYNIKDDIVIYTGYTKEELENGQFGKDAEVSRTNYKYLKDQYKNIIIKFGRYYPKQTAHLDDVLGVNLISDNQYAEKVS